MLGGQTLPADCEGSGRLDLANWIASPDNPLTARVIANRVWHHHFGRGLVASTSDFGVRGERPSHPELLDYLARYLIEHDWSIKSLHRLILTSRTWQLSSASVVDNQSIDPDNVFLWRSNRRRLDAEQLRDTVLSLSGQLDRSVGQTHPFPHRMTYFFRQHEPFVGDFDNHLRSVYQFRQRIRKDPYLDLFDAPDGNLHVGTRRPTTTSLQALFLLNSEFIVGQSRVIADRLVSECDTRESCIHWAYQHLFSRLPRPAEIETVSQQLERLAAQSGTSGSGSERRVTSWAPLLQAMLCSNEFLYID